MRCANCQIVAQLIPHFKTYLIWLFTTGCSLDTLFGPLIWLLGHVGGDGTGLLNLPILSARRPTVRPATAAAAPHRHLLYLHLHLDIFKTIATLCGVVPTRAHCSCTYFRRIQETEGRQQQKAASVFHSKTCFAKHQTCSALE